MLRRISLSVFLLLVSVATFAGEFSQSKDIYTFDTDCGVVVVVISPKLTSDMTVEEMIIETEQSITTEFVESEECVQFVTPSKKTKKVTKLSVIQASDYFGTIESYPPAPPGDEWVLIDVFQHRTAIKSQCITVVTDGWVYRRPDGTGGYEYETMTQTYSFNIPGCIADEFPGPN